MGRKNGYDGIGVSFDILIFLKKVLRSKICCGNIPSLTVEKVKSAKKPLFKV